MSTFEQGATVLRAAKSVKQSLDYVRDRIIGFLDENPEAKRQRTRYNRVDEILSCYHTLFESIRFSRARQHHLRVNKIEGVKIKEVLRTKLLPELEQEYKELMSSSTKDTRGAGGDEEYDEDELNENEDSNDATEFNSVNEKVHADVGRLLTSLDQEIESEQKTLTKKNTTIPLAEIKRLYTFWERDATPARTETRSLAPTAFRNPGPQLPGQTSLSANASAPSLSMDPFPGSGLNPAMPLKANVQPPQVLSQPAMQPSIQRPHQISQPMPQGSLSLHMSSSQQPSQLSLQPSLQLPTSQPSLQPALQLPTSQLSAQSLPQLQTQPSLQMAPSQPQPQVQPSLQLPPSQPAPSPAQPTLSGLSNVPSQATQPTLQMPTMGQLGGLPTLGSRSTFGLAPQPGGFPRPGMHQGQSAAQGLLPRQNQLGTSEHGLQIRAPLKLDTNNPGTSLPSAAPGQQLGIPNPLSFTAQTNTGNAPSQQASLNAQSEPSTVLPTSLFSSSNVPAKK